MNVPTIGPQELHQLRRQGQTVEVLDVRTPTEHSEVHIQGARLVPLDQFDAAALAAWSQGKPLYLICRSGMRSAKACEQLIAAGHTNAFNVDGGMVAWEKAGLPVERGERQVMSLERQVRIAAGTLVLIGIALGVLVHPALLGLAALIGAGLVFSGVTNSCGMGLLLAKMPWNRGASSGSCSSCPSSSPPSS